MDACFWTFEITTFRNACQKQDGSRCLRMDHKPPASVPGASNGSLARFMGVLYPLA